MWEHPQAGAPDANTDSLTALSKDDKVGNE